MQITINKHLLKRSIISYLLYPASLLFCSVQTIRRLLYKHIFLQYEPPVFVISVGNIVAGGTGKTPFTIYLAELLRENKLSCAVSHRGYKSGLENQETLISNKEGLLPQAENAGDEAWLIAHKLKGIPVVAGRNRKKAIQLLLRDYPDLDCIILDDSFQHLQVKHNLDLILVNQQLGFGNGFVLPAGYLREPVSALKAADAVIFNHSGSVQLTNSVLLKKIELFKRPVYSGSYITDNFYDFYMKSIDTEALANEKVVLLSGIGNPEGFENTVKSFKPIVVKHIILSDHYDYSSTAKRMEIIRTFADSAAKWLVTTEKDFSKLRLYPEFKDCLMIVGIRFMPDKKAETLSSYIMHEFKDFTKVR